jgi:hypothetical protein
LLDLFIAYHELSAYTVFLGQHSNKYGPVHIFLACVPWLLFEILVSWNATSRIYVTLFIFVLFIFSPVLRWLFLLDSTLLPSQALILKLNPDLTWKQFFEEVHLGEL